MDMLDLRFEPIFAVLALLALACFLEARLVTVFLVVDSSLCVDWLWAMVLAEVAEDITPRLLAPLPSNFAKISGLRAKEED